MLFAGGVWSPLERRLLFLGGVLRAIRALEFLDSREILKKEFAGCHIFSAHTSPFSVVRGGRWKYWQYSLCTVMAQAARAGPWVRTGLPWFPAGTSPVPVTSDRSARTGSPLSEDHPPFRNQKSAG